MSTEPILPQTWGQIAFMAGLYLLLAMRKVLPHVVDLSVAWFERKKRDLDSDTLPILKPEKTDEESPDP